MIKGAVQRISELVDEGSFHPVDDELRPRDPLEFPGYASSLTAARAASSSDESVIFGEASIGGHSIEIAAFDFAFLGGSMGEVAGERIARSVERAAQAPSPFILITSTGGARMQEGMRSLVQMPKVVAARLSLTDAHQPFIAILGDPTTGGVLASIAALADLSIAETEATVGFAGPRIVEAHTGTKLAERSHTAAGALAAGLVDAMCDAEATRLLVDRTLRILTPGPISPVEPPSAGRGPATADAWTTVTSARSSERPVAPQLAREIGSEHTEIRGDRAGTDDGAVFAALSKVGGRSCLLLALDRHKHPGPGAYRKTRRALELAVRLQLPVAALVDTPGADPSEASEAGGIAWEIAKLFEAMLIAPVPILSVVTGEGGSGGALAFATADTLLAYDDSIFSVITPEGAANILWRDPGRAPEAAASLKLTAGDLIELHIADGLVAGPPSAENLRRVVAYHLGRLQDEALDPSVRVERRKRRWRDDGR